MKKTPTPATVTVSITEETGVEHVGLTESFAWIRFDSGLKIELSRLQVEAIARLFAESVDREEILALLSEEMKEKARA